MTYTRASSKTSNVRMIARTYRRGKMSFVKTDSAPRGGTGVRKGCRKPMNINTIRYAVAVPVSPCRGPDKNIRWINLWWIYQQTLKALNFSMRCQKEASDSRDGHAMPHIAYRVRESTCTCSGMPNTLGTATTAFIHMAKSFHFYQIMTSRP
jgi:hypothetical protein